MDTYLVGGAVRDKLLNLPVAERDWVVVGATPEAMQALGFRQVGRDFPVFLHPDTNEEYALARTERKAGSGHRGFICHADPDVTLEADLQRRDLTINAMAEDGEGRLIDPYGGRRDLEARLLRHVSPAFVEDPLRVLRVARFAARLAHLGFQVAPETRALMRDISKSGELDSLAAERIWSELERALAEPSPSACFRVLLDCDALPALYPDWAAGITPSLLEALERAVDHDADTISRFALMCSHLSEPQCRELCQQLKAPRQYAALAQLACRLSPLPDQPDAETLLRLLETMDCLRRPAQVERLLSVERALHPARQSLALFAEAAERVRDISPQPLLEQGLRGEELGRALRARRLQAVEELSCPNTRPSP